jgi:hypothetical protein
MAITVRARGKFRNGWKDSKESERELMCVLRGHQLQHVLGTRGISISVSETTKILYFDQIKAFVHRCTKCNEIGESVKTALCINAFSIYPQILNSF